MEDQEKIKKFFDENLDQSCLSGVHLERNNKSSQKSNSNMNIEDSSKK